MFITNPDLKWADKYPLPRMSGQLPFVLALNAYLESAYGGMKAEFTSFGKPSKLTFEYAEEVLREQAAEFGVDITEIYMIGDNLSGDIKGPKLMEAGWNSILVQSGVYQPEDRDSLPADERPTFEVKNMEEAIKKVIEKERLGDLIKF